MIDNDDEQLDEASDSIEEEMVDEPIVEDGGVMEQTEEIVEEQSEPEDVVVNTTSYSGSDAFVAFVRYEDKVLLMQRADGVADFPGA